MKLAAFAVIAFLPAVTLAQSGTAYAVLGGMRRAGEYSRVEAHGLYWTASDNDSATASFYNFGKGGGALHRGPQGDKQMAISVRCVRE